MTEPIKQEIINNIFENGDKLITGPILQTVLIDMIDDVNVKDQEILSKTGSWDDAATQIPNLATKEEVTNLSESVARDLENVVGGDLTGYATEQWVQSQGYLTEHQDISGLATKAELTEAENNLQGNITSLSESVARDLASVPEGVATEAWVQSQDYASKSYVDNAVSSSSVDLTGYATETWVQNQGYLKEHQDISNLATKSELTSVSESVQTDITNLSESVANSAVWKKGTGTDSIVQAIADGKELPTATGKRAIAVGYETIASGLASHAEGYNAKASGQCSHAEGYGAKASGYYSHAEGGNTAALGDYSHAEGSHTTASRNYSHAEGGWTQAPKDGSHAEGRGTNASGEYSHAEGGYTTTSNQYEHAQGQYNYTSSNQIFSVGAGEKIGETVTRRNAVSILEVPNSDTQVVTASFFVQNVGGYDGTNPTPGTNDLATVINSLPSGGSSETLWKKGTGQDSIVQILTGDDEAYTPTATGKRAIAIGFHATASGDNSYAEGNSTASGSYSHAEGHGTLASGIASHAEGYYTTASNTSEHAQGRFNHNSENQIFSVGAGEWGDISNPQGNRRNAISVLAVPNADTKINTASFFVQNIGGYDGTNPIPGTNDLATVINGMSTGGGSSETLWKKGTGTDSIVQAIAEGTNLPTATGKRAIAVGTSTSASGDYSHAEGANNVASAYGSHAEGNNTHASSNYSHAEGFMTSAGGLYSHAEGSRTNTSGMYSHAEGYFTETSNDCEHAQGRYNHSSTNQIFSVGAGERVKGTTTRRNAVSVLVVPNSETQINTASVFVQNIGGYDGTNPEPGTNDLATVINNLPSGGSSETLWKKGTGKDSIVQTIAEGTNLPTATGERAIATGLETKASGNYSHAEGSYTIASGESSHAEGDSSNASGTFSHTEGANTVASGDGSHAEGIWTRTSNNYEHAQGRYNHSSTDQIFSIGTGNSNTDRRNAVSVLEVDNSGSYTSSSFVQNIGGYDGTNPTPGTNDLATVINNTETWTFTLEDGSTVTKNIRIA